MLTMKYRPNPLLWHMLVVPTTLETKVGGLWLEASPRKSTRPYLKVS